MKMTRHFQLCLALLTAFATLAICRAGADESQNNQNPKTEAELIEVLRTAPPADKALACKQLATVGSKAAVPELARLLTDEHLASWARIALEAIPDPAADDALRSALPNLHGKLLVGAINSIAVRRDADAVGLLANRLHNPDAEVASAAAVALGSIGNDAATKTLQQTLVSADHGVREAVAEGCILCAERLLQDDRTAAAAEVYDQIRRASVSKPRKLEAIRGAILARKSDGIPILMEQLRSPDRAYYQIGLSTARELPGREVADALAAELANTSTDRATSLLYVLADRNDPAVLPAVLVAAKSGDKPLRIVALGVVGKLGDVSALTPLLESAADGDGEVAESAKAAIVALGDKRVDTEIAKRVESAAGKQLALLIELVGQRRIDATPLLTKKLDDSDPIVRGAALAALGAIVKPDDLAVLIAQAVHPKDLADEQIALRALRAACLRMPDPEACAAKLDSAMPNASPVARVSFVEILGAVGGTKALESIGVAMRTKDPQLQDAGSRVLGEWMNVDAAPVLLELTRNAADDKYRVRALRGYIRLARQFAMPEQQRAEMCQTAIDASNRPEEQKLALAVLERYPNLETFKVAAKATKVPALRDEARKIAAAIAEKLGDEGAKVREVLAQCGVQPVQVDIVKAEYGAGSSQKDVTETLQKCVGALPLIPLPSATYNDSFGGDPAPGTAKILKVQYRINGKEGDVSFPENALIALPMPK